MEKESPDTNVQSSDTTSDGVGDITKPSKDLPVIETEEI